MYIFACISIQAFFMKNDFKYLGVFTSSFIGLIFMLGVYANFKNGNATAGGSLLLVSLAFFALAYLTFQRAQKKKKSHVPSSTIAYEKLPKKHYAISKMTGGEAAITKLIFLAIDQVKENDMTAAEILLKQAETKITKASEASKHEATWLADIEKIREVIQ